MKKCSRKIYVLNKRIKNEDVNQLKFIAIKTPPIAGINDHQSCDHRNDLESQIINGIHLRDLNLPREREKQTE